MTTGKTIALTRRTLVGKVMSLLFNILSAAAAAKSLQSCPTLCDPRDGSPPGSAHGIIQARILEWVAILGECWRIDAFKLWSWRKLLRVPWTARSKQSILKVINPEYSLERLMLKLQYFGYLMQRANSLGKILMVGKIEGKKRRRQQRMRWLMVSSTQ